MWRSEILLTNMEYAAAGKGRKRPARREEDTGAAGASRDKRTRTDDDITRMNEAFHNNVGCL